MAKPKLIKIRSPYHMALKAYAYANKSLDYALEQLGYMDLEVPDKSNPNHVHLFRALTAQFILFKKSAKRRSRDFSYSSAQLISAGVSPMYEWIVEDGDPVTPEALFMDQVVDIMRNAELRKRLSISLHIGVTPERISSDMAMWGAGIVLAPPHVAMYQRFLWDTMSMGHEDLVNYAYITRPTLRSADGGTRLNPHWQYINKMTSFCSKAELVIDSELPFEYVDTPQDDILLKKISFRLNQSLDKGDQTSVKIYANAYARFKDSSEEKGTDASRELRKEMDKILILGSPTTVKKLGIDMKALGHKPPISLSEIQGEVSDPRLTGVGPDVRKHGPEDSP